MMFTVYDLRHGLRERSRRREILRITPPERDGTQSRFLALETLRDWGAITDEELVERKRAVLETETPDGES